MSMGSTDEAVTQINGKKRKTVIYIKYLGATITDDTKSVVRGKIELQVPQLNVSQRDRNMETEWGNVDAY